MERTHVYDCFIARLLAQQRARALALQGGEEATADRTEGQLSARMSFCAPDQPHSSNQKYKKSTIQSGRNFLDAPWDDGLLEQPSSGSCGNGWIAIAQMHSGIPHRSKYDSQFLGQGKYCLGTSP